MKRKTILGEAIEQIRKTGKASLPLADIDEAINESVRETSHLDEKQQIY